MIEFGTLTKDEAVRGIRRLGTIAQRCYGQGASNDAAPTLTAKPSIHPSGLLQWHAEQYDEGLVEAIDETRASWWGRRVTDQSIDELKS